MMHSGISQAREFDDPPGLKEKTDQLLREWVTMYHSQNSGKDSTKAFSTFVTQMHTQGILKTDDLITRFFRICTEVCVDVCYRALNDSTNSPNHSLTRARCYHTLDAFVRLIALLVRHSGDAANTLTKINLLNKASSYYNQPPHTHTNTPTPTHWKDSARVVFFSSVVLCSGAGSVDWRTAAGP